MMMITFWLTLRSLNPPIAVPIASPITVPGAADRSWAGDIQIGPRGGVVGSQWELVEAGTREQNDADCVTLQPGYQVRYLEFGAVEAGGASRPVRACCGTRPAPPSAAPRALDNLDFAAPLRPPQGDDYQRYSDEPQSQPSKAHPLAGGAQAARQAPGRQYASVPRPGARRPTARITPGRAARPRPTGTVGMRRSYRAQGSLLNAVLERTSSSSSSAQGRNKEPGQDLPIADEVQYLHIRLFEGVDLVVDLPSAPPCRSRDSILRW